MTTDNGGLIIQIQCLEEENTALRLKVIELTKQISELSIELLTAEAELLGLYDNKYDYVPYGTED